MASRICTGPRCEKELTGNQKLYCSPKCKARAQRAKRSEAAAAHRSELPAPTPDDVALAAQEVLKERLRAQLPADVTDAAVDMVALSGTAVAALQEDLESKDPNIRQRAYALWLKYTVGSQALMPSLTDDTQSPMTVVIANMPATVEPRNGAPHADFDGEVVPAESLPRRDPEAPALPAPSEADAQALKECDTCHTFKPEAQFEASSDRCTDCFMRLRSQALSTFGESASGGS